MMILGRPANLVVGAFQTILGAVVIILFYWSPPVVIPNPVIGAVVLAFGAIISLIANQTPTVNSGDTVTVVTAKGEPNKIVTV